MATKLAVLVLFSAAFGGVGYGLWMESFGAGMFMSVVLIIGFRLSA